MTKTFQIASGDWVIDRSTGRPKTISDTEKLKQDVKECLSIARQSNGFGAGLEDIVGIVAEPIVAQSMITRSVNASMTSMRDLQYSNQYADRTLKERIERVAALSVTARGEDKVSYLFRVDVVSEDGVRLVLSGSVT